MDKGGDHTEEILLFLFSVICISEGVLRSKSHTITAVFDLSAYTETGFISCFAEPEEAAAFLTYKRGR